MVRFCNVRVKWNLSVARTAHWQLAKPLSSIRVQAPSRILFAVSGAAKKSAVDSFVHIICFVFVLS